MGNSLSPRTVFLTLSFVVVSLICQATVEVIHLFGA